jgi:DNA-3-methyladenine glycosylase II
MTQPLTDESYGRAIRVLAKRDGDLARVVSDHGAPPRRARDPGFATLALLILEQQVSLASAKATYDRLQAACGAVVEPDSVLGLGDDGLKSVGLSRQKSRYVRLLAEAVEGGALDVEGLGGLGDDAVRAELTRITGIGEWTADIYLLSALHRADVFPAKDLALQVAAHEIKRLDARPDHAALGEIGEAWRPYRAVAARILWHHYLNTKRLKRKDATP